MPKPSARFQLPRLIRESSTIEREVLLLVTLSVADVLLTHRLLGLGMHVYESNPLARWVFDRWNIGGMAIYKFAIIAGVVAICEVVERARPGLGKIVLGLGCLAAAAVVVHSLRLLAQHA
jgi:hypothetical protein